MRDLKSVKDYCDYPTEEWPHYIDSSAESHSHSLSNSPFFHVLTRKCANDCMGSLHAYHLPSPFICSSKDLYPGRLLAIHCFNNLPEKWQIESWVLCMRSKLSLPSIQPPHRLTLSAAFLPRNVELKSTAFCIGYKLSLRCKYTCHRLPPHSL